MTKQWFRIAARDLKVASLMVTYGTQFKNEIAFHVQQGIEKSLKGYLVFHNVRPPKTHNIEELAALAKTIDPKVFSLFKNTKRISKYAVTYRYPSEEDRPLRFVNVKADLVLAKKVFERLHSEASSHKTK